MKQWLKKQKYKIAIALCSILSIFTLFLGINKTYAYETNQFTYTIDSISIYNATITQHWSYDANTHVITSDANRNDSGQLYLQLHFNNTISYYNSNFLLNYNIEYSTDNINFSTYYTSSSSEYAGVTGYRVTNFSNSYSIFLGQIRPNVHNYNSISNMFTIIANTYSNNSLSGNDIYVNLALFSNTSYYYRITILNIDYVSSTDIGLQQYYDTYYGSIEDNYNQLQQDYNELQDNYDDLENDYNSLDSSYESLADDYNTLQDNYDDLESNYNTLDSNYNTLESNYNTLESNYNTLSNNYNALIDSASSLWNNIYYFGLADNDSTLYTDLNSYLINGYSLRSYDDLVNSNIINGSYIYFNNLYSLVNANTYNFLIPFRDGTNSATYGNHYWNYNVSSINFKAIVDTNLTFTNNEGIYLSLGYFSSGANTRIWLVHITSTDLISNNYIIDKDLILKLYPDIDFDFYNTILDISVIFDKEDVNTDKFSLYSIANDYSIGYSVGYNEGQSNGMDFVNYSLNERINNLESYNSDLISQITSMQLTINALNEQINSFHSDYGINNMLWTIASTPFESFRTIWNVELFGVNISRVISGFLTSIIVLFIVKKFLL